MKVKIKTLVNEWYGQTLLFCRSHEGPVVEFDDSDVMAVESQSESWVPDEHLNAYVYFKTDRMTITVRYLDLLEVSPELAKKAKKSLLYKVHAPDPCAGSCS